MVLGHVPKNLSKIELTLLSLLHSALDIFLIGKGINRGKGYRLQIPANFYFYNPEKAINWLKNEIKKNRREI